jgi:hypothetical protein
VIAQEAQPALGRSSPLLQPALLACP